MNVAELARDGSCASTPDRDGESHVSRRQRAGVRHGVFRTSEIPEIPAGIRCRSATTRLEIDTQAQRAERCDTGLYRGASHKSSAPDSAIGPLSFISAPPLTELECWSA